MIENPYVIFSQDVLVSNYKLLASLNSNIRIFYPIKTNKTNVVLEILSSLGANFLVSSYDDLLQLENLGVDTKRILFGEKLPSSLTDLANISILEMDSENVVPLLKAPSLETVLFRLQSPPEFGAKKTDLKWGMSKTELEKTIQYNNKKLAKLKLGIGIHCSGNCFTTRKNSINVLSQHLLNYMRIFENEELEISFIDLGGGIDWKGRYAEYALHTISSRFENIEIWVEPGTFIVEDAFKVVCSVLDIRYREEEIWVYVNTSIYDGLIDVVLIDKRLELGFSELKGSEMMNARLVGYSNDVLDDFGTFSIPKNIAKGQKIEILNTGAYFFDLATSFARGAPASIR